MIVTFFSISYVFSEYLRKVLTRIRLEKLCSAIKRKDTEKIRQVLLQDPDIVRFERSKDIPQECSPLWAAIAYSCEEVIELAIDFGCDVDGPDSNGITFLHQLPLLFDEWQIYKKCAEILVKRGANVNLKDYRMKLSPLFIAIKLGHVQYAEFLLKNGAKLEGIEPIHSFPISAAFFAPFGKQTEILELFIKNGLDPETRYNLPIEYDCLQFTIIFSGEFEDDIDVVGIAKILLDCGLSANGMDSVGVTTLNYAINLQNIELICTLIARGADINSEANKGGFAPLIRAIDHDDEEIVDLLFYYGANINVKDENGRTALHEACRGRREKSIKRLIRRGANISEQDFIGMTPFSLLEPQHYKEADASCIGTMVKEMALSKFWKDLTVSEDDMNLVNSHPVVRELFQTCTDELHLMLNTKFYSSFSYNFVFGKPENFKKLIELSKNEEFVSKFEENLQMFPCYYDELQSIFNRIIISRNRSLIVISRLYSIFKKYFPDIVIRKLAEHLTPWDLPLE